VGRFYNVISPHLDDVALSCSLFLAANPGSRIITVFDGAPASVSPLPPWDAASGIFSDGADVSAVRRAEDVRAAALVRASTVHLGYWDSQYRNEDYGYQGPPDDELAGVIAEDLARRLGQDPWPLVIPLGLCHFDHRTTAEACLILAGRRSGDTYLYEDLPYSVEYHDAVADQKAALAGRGLALEEYATIGSPDTHPLKLAVIMCHASQRHPLGRQRIRIAVRTPERIWKLVRGKHPAPEGMQVRSGPSGEAADPGRSR
jgi:LmbE family N-acetylglucosaminyl deacetylase